jgi:bacterioferritin
MAQARSQNAVYDITNIKHLAKKSLEKGAVTQDYTLDTREACKLLNEALATEIMCVLRYRHHQVMSKGIAGPELSAEFAEHASDEERHMMMLAERIDQLGGTPDFNPLTIAQRTATEYGCGTNIDQLLEEDLIAERVAIMVYRKLITWFGDQDPTTRRMLEDILQDEEDHANDLSDLMDKQN